MNDTDTDDTLLTHAQRIAFDHLAEPTLGFALDGMSPLRHWAGWRRPGPRPTAFELMLCVQTRRYETKLARTMGRPA